MTDEQHSALLERLDIIRDILEAMHEQSIEHNRRTIRSIESAADKIEAMILICSPSEKK